MKNIANFVSITRMLMSVLLIFLPLPSAVFYGVYIAAGLSDLLDGYLARKFRCVSRTGSVLDKSADLVLYFTLLIKLFISLDFRLWAVITAACAAFLKGLCPIIGGIKFKRLCYTHTHLNRAAGFSVFLWPIIALMFGDAPAALLIAAVTILSAAEELIIIIISKTFNNKRKCLFPLDRL